MDINTLLIAILGSGAFFTFLEFLIKFISEKFSKKKFTVEKLGEMFEEDKKKYNMHHARTNFLLVIVCSPNNIIAVLDAARDYFEDHGGNSYASDIFQEWLDDHNLAYPEWFHPHIREGQE